MLFAVRAERVREKRTQAVVSATVWINGGGHSLDWHVFCTFLGEEVSFFVTDNSGMTRALQELNLMWFWIGIFDMIDLINNTLKDAFRRSVVQA